MLLGDVEQRVVAEAVVAPGSQQDTPLPAGLADQRHGIPGVAHIDQGALEARTALRLGYPFQCGQQFGIVGGVALPGVAGRVDARLSPEVVHLQPGVIRDRRVTAVPGRGAGLDDGVLDETEAGFRHFRHLELRLGDQP